MRFGEGYAMLLIMTGGTCELILTPVELSRMSKRTIFGQTIRVTYDPTGHVTGESLDGESLSLFGFRRSATRDPEKVISAPTCSPETVGPPSPPANPVR